MKILMRADTHVNIELPGNAPVAKCTFTQVSTATLCNFIINLRLLDFIPDLTLEIATRLSLV